MSGIRETNGVGPIGNQQQQNVAPSTSKDDYINSAFDTANETKEKGIKEKLRENDKVTAFRESQLKQLEDNLDSLSDRERVEAQECLDTFRNSKASFLEVAKAELTFIKYTTVRSITNYFNNEK